MEGQYGYRPKTLMPQVILLSGSIENRFDEPVVVFYCVMIGLSAIETAYQQYFNI
jgi:hypothetical protein